jgi:hypothetical protein
LPTDGKTEMSATAAEIEEWEEEHDEPHPIFEVEHRPERKTLNSPRDTMSNTQGQLTDKFDAKDRLGYCEDAGRDHIEEDVVESLDGERWICFWCDEQVPKYV